MFLRVFFKAHDILKLTEKGKMSKNTQQFNATSLSKTFRQIYEAVYYSKLVILLVILSGLVVSVLAIRPKVQTQPRTMDFKGNKNP
jgi:hypothetical protein